MNMQNIELTFNSPVITETNSLYSNIVKQIKTDVIVRIEDTEYKFLRYFDFDTENLQNFIQFENLTKDIVTNWIFEKYENELLRLKNNAVISHNEYKNPSKPVIEIKDFNF